MKHKCLIPCNQLTALTVTITHICGQIFSNPDLSLTKVPAKTLFICNNLKKSQLLQFLHGPESPASAPAMFLGQTSSPDAGTSTWMDREVCWPHARQGILGEATEKPPLESDVSAQGVPCLRRGFLSSCFPDLAPGSSVAFCKAWGPGG